MNSTSYQKKQQSISSTRLEYMPNGTIAVTEAPKAEQWQLQTSSYSDSKIFSYGDKITREQFETYSKQVVNEKIQRLLENWHHSEEKALDLQRWMHTEMENLEKVCEYCLENHLVTKGIQIVGGRVEWY